MINTNTNLPAKKGRPRNTTLHSLRTIIHNAIEYTLSAQPFLSRFLAFRQIVEKAPPEALPFRPGTSLRRMYKTYMDWRARSKK